MSFVSNFKIESGQGLRNWQILPSTRLLVWMHERITALVKLHVQVFLRMDTWVFETCRRH